MYRTAIIYGSWSYVKDNYSDEVLGSTPSLGEVEVFWGMCENGRGYMSLLEVAFVWFDVS